MSPAQVVSWAREALIAPLSVVIVLLIRLIRPIVLVRFGRLSTRRIGHLAWNTEFYACERDVTESPSSVDVFCWYPPVANQQLLKMWRRSLHISRWVAPVWRYNRMIPGGGAHDVIIGMDRFEYARRLLEETKVHLRFTEEEEEFGLKALDHMGIQPDDEFICLHVRDGAYLAQEFSEGRWDYHDFRDASIENFLPAVNALAEQGYFVIRMGATAKEPFGGEQTKVIDYSWDHRTDFMDIFLLSRCRFLLGTNSGVADVADIFRRPVLRTNMIQFWAEIPLCKSKDVFIPKKLWKKDENRFLSFPELIDSDLWETNISKQYSDAGVEPVENSSDEIVAAVDEMEARLNRTHRPELAEEALQNRFWDLMQSRGVVSGPPHAKIGSDFIVRNEVLLS